MKSVTNLNGNFNKEFTIVLAPFVFRCVIMKVFSGMSDFFPTRKVESSISFLKYIIAISFHFLLQQCRHLEVSGKGVTRCLIQAVGNTLP